MNTILVPTDFSADAEKALNFAHDLAKISNSEIRLLHVVEYPGIESFHAGGETNLTDGMDKVFMMQLLRKVKTDIRALAEDPKYSDITVHYNVMVGHPWKSISKEIADSNADIVVIGSKGATGAEEVLLGSTAEKVVRFAHCPVITIKEPTRVELLKDIVYATNMVDDQSKVMENLKVIQKILHAKIHLLRVNTPYAFIGSREAKEKLKQFAEAHNMEDYTLNTYDEFREETGILNFAEDNDCDIIAMSTHSHTGLVHMFTGSIAEDVVNHAKRPVWTLSLKA